MKISDFDLDKNVFVVAEIGNNHEGDFGVAKELIRAAVDTGVDAVKFQTFIPEDFISREHQERIKHFQKFQLSSDQFIELAHLARSLGVIFFSTPLDLISAKFLNTLQPVFKIASGDNNCLPLIDTVASFGKPMIISTGLADFNLLDQVYDRVKGVWRQASVQPGLAFLHCVASYPVPLGQANIAAIANLKHRYPGITIGYSDHTIGVNASIYAVAAGAQIIEKHFTLDKHFSKFRDHQVSADATDMAYLVKSIREVSVMLGSGIKEMQPCEEKNASMVRRSIAAARDLSVGTIVTLDDLIWVRPGTGISPGEEKKILGHRIKNVLLQGDLIRREDVE